jgi:4-amino-4-deoxy-L-arabinose transferase-like glycosyltransferase
MSVTARGRAVVDRVRRWDRALIGILLVAAAVRLPWPGLYQLEWDELHLLYESQALARDGKWLWLSNITSWSAIPGHSPFNNYVAAIPYLFTLDPRAHRVVVGLLCIVAVGISYWTMKRYFGRWAAIMAGITLATAPLAVAWSRAMFHPDIAQPLLALWILTGLMGYYEGRRGAQIAHWGVLSLTVQTDAAYVPSMIPLSGALLIIGWFNPQTDRRALVRATAWGWGLFGLTMLPWIIGLLDAGLFEHLSDPRPPQPHYGLRYVQELASLLISSTKFWEHQRSLAPDGWWPPERLEWVLWAKTWLTFGSVFWLAIEIRRRRWDAVPAVVLVMLTFWPLVLFPISPVFLVEWHLMPMLFGAIGIQGVVLARMGTFRSWTRWPVAIFVCATLVVHGWLLAGAYRWLHDEGTEHTFFAPMYVHQDLLREWDEDGDAIIALLEVYEGKYTWTLQNQWWRVLGRQFGVRQITMPQGIPVDPGGTVVVGAYDGATIPSLFGEGEIAGELSNGAPMFRKVVIPPGYQPDLAYVPQDISRFASGARILGLSADSEPQPGQPWPVILAWTPERDSVGQQYQFSVRLVDADGATTYAQMDGPSLAGSLWRTGDIVLNRLELPVSETLPADVDLRVQLVMYTWPDVANVDAVNEDGAIVAPWLFLVPAKAS